MWKRWAYPAAALLVFVTVALAVRLVWESRDRYATTGDEPHYLIAARSLSHFHTVDMTEAYQEEFTRGYYYPPRFPAAPGALPTAATTAHTTKGPHGYALEHGLGIPMLIAAPNAWWGPTGARVWLIILSSGIVLVAWFAGGLALRSQEARLAATLATAVALPWVTNANQIFPDLTAGLVCGIGILACAYLSHCERGRSRLVFSWIAAFALVLFPWLHIRFSSTGAILAVALVALAMHSRAMSRLASCMLALPFVLSLLGALAYNAYVYGGAFSVNGQGSAHIAVGKQSLMVLLGMHIDRLQGMFVQNPLLLFGFVGTIVLWNRSRLLALVIALTYASVIVLPALELLFYGGQSLAPRFALAGAGVLLVPTMITLGDLRERTVWGFALLLVAVAGLEAFYLARVLSKDFSLYNLAGPPPALVYTGLIPGPEFFDPDRFLHAKRNYAAVALFVATVSGLTAYLWPRPRRTAVASVDCGASAVATDSVRSDDT